MNIRIIHGFRGRETNELYWPPDSIQEVDESLGQQLVDNGQAALAPRSITKIIAPSEIDGDRDTQDTMDTSSPDPRPTKRK